MSGLVERDSLGVGQRLGSALVVIGPGHKELALGQRAARRAIVDPVWVVG